MSKSEENLLTPKCSDVMNYRMSWTGPGGSKLPVSDEEGTPIMEDLNPSNFYSEPVLVAGKPPVIPSKLRQVPTINKPEKCPVDSPFGEEEKHMAQKTLRMIKKAFLESGSDLQCLIADSRSSLKSESKLTESEAHLQASVNEMSIDHCKSKSNLKLYISDTAHTKEKEVVNQTSSFKNPKDTEIWVRSHVQSSTLLMSENNKCSLSVNCHDCSCEQANVIKEVKPQQSIANEDQGLTFSAKERGVETGASAVMVQSVENGPDVLQSEATSPAKPNLTTVQSSESKISPIVKRLRVSDHIQRFNNLSLNDPGAKKVKSPLSFERTPVRQSVRKFNSLSEIRKQTSASILVEPDTTAAPLQKSVSCSSTFASRVEQVSKNSVTPKPCTVLLNLLPSSSQTVQKNIGALRTLRSKVGNFGQSDGLVNSPPVGDPKVGVMQSKCALEDLTNQEIPRKTGKGALEGKQRMGNTVTDTAVLGLARKLSGKEKNKYKGSPKNPIAKTQLLLTSRSLDL